MYKKYFSENFIKIGRELTKLWNSLRKIVSKKLEESQRVPSILLRKIDIANLVKFATTKQLVALIFTILFFNLLYLL